MSKINVKLLKPLPEASLQVFNIIRVGKSVKVILDNLVLDGQCCEKF